MKYTVYHKDTDEEVKLGEHQEFFLTQEGVLILHTNDGSGGIDYKYCDNMYYVVEIPVG